MRLLKTEKTVSTIAFSRLVIAQATTPLIHDATDLKYNDTQHTPELLAAATGFLNRFFHPRVPLAPTNILAGNGLTSLLDTLFFNLADEGNVVLVPTPSYGMFFHDLTTRNGLHVCSVPCDDITKARFRQHVRPGRPPPELFKRLTEAAEAQRKLGREVKAVLIANPENPLACCYSQGMLRWIVKWCEQEGVHLVVDEVYALSGGEVFNSMLSLELGEMRENVHVLYGMAKVSGFKSPFWGACFAPILTRLVPRILD